MTVNLSKAPTFTAPLLLGQVLLRDFSFHQSQLDQALDAQSRLNAPLGEILLQTGQINEKTLLQALSKQSGLPIIDIFLRPPSPTAAALLPAHIATEFGCIVWRKIGSQITIVIDQPQKQDAISKYFAGSSTNITFALATASQIEAATLAYGKTEMSHRANTVCPEDVSCRAWAKPASKLWGIGIIIAVLAILISYPTQSISFAFYWVFCVLTLTLAFKATCFIAYLRNPLRPATPLPAGRLPKVSILIPLLNEGDILPRLITRLEALDYSKALLEIILIHEANDPVTRDHLNRTRLPTWFRTIEVPISTLQTKPRAMNYALPFCKGQIIGVYDAEDAPEHDQIEKVVAHLGQDRKDVACVQAELAFYNAKTNWISRCFSIEYAILFRVLLKGIDALGLPLPLGGTSVYFKRDALVEVGQWDAHNVTEDADLGFRLRRLGYRCECIQSVTYEEANYRAIPWIKQRSRWLKGFLLTWLTHSKRPMKLTRDMNLGGTLAFHTMMLGTFSTCLTAPIVWPLWVLSLGYKLPYFSLLSDTFLQSLVILFITSELFSMMLGLTATNTRSLKHLRKWVPTMIFYAPLASLAAYKALWEMFTRPLYWDKTEHGINDIEHETSLIELLNQVPEDSAESNFSRVSNA